MQVKPDVAKDFLTELWLRAPDDHFILIWTMPDKRSRWFRCTRDGIQAAADTVEQLGTHNVYMGAGLAGKSYGSRQRVSAAEVVGISALWADIDIAGPPHKKPNLPESVEDAMQLLDEAGPEPSILVHSGHGLQAWWVLDEHWQLSSDEERSQAAHLARKWNSHLQAIAKGHGWTVDSTHDLARVMRLPGTLNTKSDPKEVHIVQRNGLSYPPSLFYERISPGAPEEAHPKTKSAQQFVESMTLDFTVKAGATPPLRKWDALRRADRNVEATFDRKRKDLKDRSPSGYDMALANYAALAGWDDQEIVDLLIYHRAEHGDDLKLNRPDYYLRTIRKCRDVAARANASEAIDVALNELDGLTDEADQDEQRLQLLDWLSPLLRTGVLRIERYGTEPSHFRMLTESGWANLGTSDQLLNQNVIRARMVEITRSVFPRMRGGDWDRVAEAIVRASVDVDMGPEPTVVGSMRGWLEDYLEQHVPAEELDETVALSRTPFLMGSDDERVFLFPAHLRTWLERSDNERLTLRELTMRLRMVGCDPRKVNVTVSGKPTSRSVWRLPRDLNP